MLVRVINGADSIFEIDLLVPLSHDATSAAENEAASMTHKLLGSEMKLACKITPSNQILSFYYNYHVHYGRFSILYKHNGDRPTDPWWAGIFSTLRLLRPAVGHVLI